MKQLAVLCFFLLSVAVQAQQLPPTKVYPVGPNVVGISSSTQVPITVPLNQVTVVQTSSGLRINYQTSGGYLNTADFLNEAGNAYGSTPAQAFDNWKAAIRAAQGSGGSSGGGGTATVSPTYLGASSNFTIAAGASFVSISNTGSTAVSVQGTNLPAGYSINFPTNTGQVLDAITVNATGGSVLYQVIR